MHILFLFVDGIGLGDDDPETNPFAIANLPTLTALTNGKRWLRDTGKQVNDRALFIPTNPRLGVEGRPQSGTNHAVILTGKNVPQIIGRHYGPKPEAKTRAIIDEHSLYKRLLAAGKTAHLLTGYPTGLLDNIASGRRLPSGMQQAMLASGQPLLTIKDIYSGDALAAEYTGHSLREHLGDTQIPLFSYREAGHKLVELSRRYDFALHSHWVADYVGHRGTLDEAVAILETIDAVITGILDKWDDSEGLVILTSDHGNMELIGDRKHTENDVPTLIIGDAKDMFAEGFRDLTDFTPHILRFLTGADG